MLYGLKTVFAAVVHKSVSVFQTECRCYLLHLGHYVSKQFTVFFSDVIQRCDMLLRYYQNVYRCLWVQIVETKYLIVFIYLVRRYLPLAYLAKDAIAHDLTSFLLAVVMPYYITLSTCIRYSLYFLMQFFAGCPACRRHDDKSRCRSRG